MENSQKFSRNKHAFHFQVESSYNGTMTSVKAKKCLKMTYNFEFVFCLGMSHIENDVCTMYNRYQHEKKENVNTDLFRQNCLLMGRTPPSISSNTKYFPRTMNFPIEFSFVFFQIAEAFELLILFQTINTEINIWSMMERS